MMTDEPRGPQRGRLRPYWCTRGTLVAMVEARNLRHARLVAGLRLAGYSPRDAATIGTRVLENPTLPGWRQIRPDDLVDLEDLARKVRARRATAQDVHRWARLLEQEQAGVEGARVAPTPNPAADQLALV